jgi:hypothetical protein
MYKIEDKAFGTLEDRQKIRSWYKRSNWKNPSDYPVSDVSADRWAWEFLRRNKEYQKDCSELDTLFRLLSKAERHLRDKELSLKHQSLCEKWGIDSYYPRAWLLNFPDGPNPDGTYTFHDFKYSAPCSFLVSRLDPISCGAAFIRLDGPDSKKLIEQGETGWGYVIPKRSDQEVLVFNLNLPIGPQVERAKETLLNGQKNLRKQTISLRHHTKQFVCYLRAYDGYEDCKDFNKLADHFSSESVRGDDFDYEQGVQNWYEAAARYIEKDYLNIPATMD